jgi:hypothetical protein
MPAAILDLPKNLSVIQAPAKGAAGATHPGKFTPIKDFCRRSAAAPPKNPSVVVFKALLPFVLGALKRRRRVTGFFALVVVRRLVVFRGAVFFAAGIIIEN